MMARQRVDEALVALGLAESLEMARALIMAGRVFLAEEKMNKPSDSIKPGLPLSVREKGRPYVSRGGLKLQKALAEFCIDPAEKTCIDVGASTGGFTDVLLKSGAARVYAVDVGYGQLDFTLRRDPRVVVMERTNARFLTPELFDPRPSFGATDVSFISLKAVLPAALSVLHGVDKRFVALVKPQFEAPAELVGEKGVVRDVQVHIDVVQGICEFALTIGWAARALAFSPITGPEGNIEFLLDLRPADTVESPLSRAETCVVCHRAYDNFVKLR